MHLQNVEREKKYGARFELVVSYGEPARNFMVTLLKYKVLINIVIVTATVYDLSHGNLIPG